MKIKTIFALAAIGVLLLAVMVIPQVEVVKWNTYKDPNGKYSIDYLAS
jgi:hypothetical protein